MRFAWESAHLRSERVGLDELVDPGKACVEMPYRVTRHHADPLIAPKLLHEAECRIRYDLIAEPRLTPEKNNNI